MILRAEVPERLDEQRHRPDGGAEKSLGQSPADRPAQPKRKKTEDVRQTGLKLPIKGGKAAVERVDVQAATKSSRKRA